LTEITTAADLGALIKSERTKALLTQQQLADQINASREWVIRAEQGEQRIEVGLLLRALSALNITVTARPDTVPDATDQLWAQIIDGGSA
jgi:transcriptional regulator with XRE-family HTH domain